MKWIALRVEIDAPDDSLATDVVAEMFRDHGIRGVVIEDPLDAQGLDWAETPAPVEGPCAVTGYIPDNDRFPKRRAALQASMADLAPRLSGRLRLQWDRIDEEDWAHSWKTHFHPIRIGRRLVICPTWRQYAAGPDDIVMALDPGMAFGTGTHATTALCLELMETHLRAGDRFLDVGTGSGILMLAAGHLGSSFMIGVDSDETALTVARDNLARNGIEKHRYLLLSANLGDALRGRFDMMAANILTPVVLRLLDDVPRLMRPGGIFLGSGILADQSEAVLAGLAAMGWRVLETREQEAWFAVAATREDPGVDG